MMPRGVRVSTYLLWLILAVSVPLLLIAGEAAWRLQSVRLQQQDQTLAESVRNASIQLEDRFARLQDGLSVLAEAGALQRGDLADFDPQIRRTAERLGVASLAVTTPEAAVLIETGEQSRAWDRLIGQVAIAAIRSGKPFISNLLVNSDPPSRRVAVAVPVFREGSAVVIYALVASINAGRLLGGRGVPSGSRPAIMLTVRDRMGDIVAQAVTPRAAGSFLAVPAGEAYTGQPEPISPELAASVEHDPAQVVSNRLANSRYIVTATFLHGPSELESQRDLIEVGCFGAVLLATGVLAVIAVARRLVRALGTIQQTEPDASLSGLLEVDELSGRLQVLSAERAEAEATLRESEARLRDLVDTLDLAAIMVREMGGGIQFWSRGCEHMYGWTAAEAVGRVSHKLLRTKFPVALSVIEHDLLEKGEWKGDLQQQRRDGTQITVAAHKALKRDDAGRPHMVMESLVDVTALREAQNALRSLNQALERRVQEEVAAREEAQRRSAHAQRIQALGQLAGGIAHDFNNVLQAVAGGAALIARRPHDGEAVTRLIRVVGDAAARGASITRRMLVLARRSDLKPQPIDAALLLHDMREMFIHTLGAAIKVAVEAEPRLPPLFADKAQLETALVNLATNARDAMPEGGIIRLKASTETILLSSPPNHAGLSPGAYVRLSVIDDGAGMTDEILARAGEPFFTTMEVGKGVGLGLSMVKGFAEQSGGGFVVDSQIGGGTTATLWLPVFRGDARNLSSRRETAIPCQPTGRILLVDDDALVRDTLMQQLEALGHKVLTASGGTDALAILHAREAVDLMITDFSMPGMNGLALIKQAHDLRPSLPTILLTGYSGDMMSLERNDVARDTYTLILKPASTATLAARVASLLEGS